MHHYWVHGLCISSELLLPELYQLSSKQGQEWSFSSPNVSIELGKTPKSLENAKSEGVLYQAAPDRFLLKLDGIARYLVEDGSRIVIQPDLQATEDEIRFFLFGSPMGALLHQQSLFILHASAIDTDRGAVVIIGSSGAGKSAIAAAFQQQGYRIITDEICTVTPDETGQLVVRPGLREIYLWGDVLRKLDYNPESLRRVRPGLDKYALTLSQVVAPEPTSLRCIYHLKTFNQPEVKLVPAKPTDKVKYLLTHTYRESFLPSSAQKSKRFNRAIEIARNIEIEEVKRPQSPVWSLDEVTATLEKNWRYRG